MDSQHLGEGREGGYGLSVSLQNSYTKALITKVSAPLSGQNPALLASGPQTFSLLLLAVQATRSMVLCYGSLSTPRQKGGEIAELSLGSEFTVKVPSST